MVNNVSTETRGRKKGGPGTALSLVPNSDFVIPGERQ